MRKGERYDDGEWTLCTLGHFLGLMVDNGHDPAVAFRVTEQVDHGDGTFTQRLEVVAIPDGQVCAEHERLGEPRIHKVLLALIQNGVVT